MPELLTCAMRDDLRTMPCEKGEAKWRRDHVRDAVISRFRMSIRGMDIWVIQRKMHPSRILQHIQGGCSNNLPMIPVRYPFN